MALDGDERLIDEFKYGSYVSEKLQEWGWIGDVDVIDTSYIKTGYTWLTADTHREEQIRYLDSMYGITSTGRYGKWRFQGISESIQDGMGV
jgi:hypothetical protein